MFIYLLAFLLWSLLGATAGWFVDGLWSAAVGGWAGALLWAVLQLARAQRLESWFRSGPAGEPPRMQGLWREVADRIIFMDQGQIVEQNEPREFFNNPQSDRTKLFLSQILGH